MRIEPPNADDVHTVALNMRARDFIEFRAVNEADTRDDMATLLTYKYANRSDVLCAFWNDLPVCIGGFIMVRPKTVGLMLYATDEFPNIGLPLTRFIVKRMFPSLIRAGVHRFEAQSLAGYTQVHDWLETLGLEKEIDAMHNYGRNKETFVQYAKVINDRSIGSSN